MRAHPSSPIVQTRANAPVAAQQPLRPGTVPGYAAGVVQVPAAPWVPPPSPQVLARGAHPATVKMTSTSENPSSGKYLAPTPARSWGATTSGMLAQTTPQGRPSSGFSSAAMVAAAVQAAEDDSGSTTVEVSASITPTSCCSTPPRSCFTPQISPKSSFRSLLKVDQLGDFAGVVPAGFQASYPPEAAASAEKHQCHQRFEDLHAEARERELRMERRRQLSLEIQATELQLAQAVQTKARTKSQDMSSFQVRLERYRDLCAERRERLSVEVQTYRQLCTVSELSECTFRPKLVARQTHRRSSSCAVTPRASAPSLRASAGVAAAAAGRSSGRLSPPRQRGSTIGSPPDSPACNASRNVPRTRSQDAVWRGVPSR